MAVDGFELAYDRTGSRSGPAVVLLHGWPGDRLALAEELIDGEPDAVRAYLRHFWAHWSGPGFELAEADLDHLVSVYSPPGAFTASVGWYRAGAGTAARALSETPGSPGAACARSKAAKSGSATISPARTPGRSWLSGPAASRRR